MRFISNKLALVLSSVTVLAYLLMYWGLGYTPAKYTIDSLTLGVGVVITWTWGSAALAAVKDGIQKPSSKIILAIWLAWTVLILQRIYVLVWNLDGQPDWLQNSPISGVITTMIFLAGMYAVIAPTQDEDTPRMEIYSLIIGTAVGSIIVGVVLGMFISKHLYIITTI